MKRFLSCLLCFLFAINSIAINAAAAEPAIDGKTPISPWDYQELLGKGMDVDWCKTNSGRELYASETAADFKEAGISHVRIRVKEDASPALLSLLERQVSDCVSLGLLPVIAYQADELKNDPSDEHLRQTVKWWETVAEHFRDASYFLSFDMLIEVTDALNRQPERLNEIYEELVAAVRKSNPERIVMISPRYRSDPEYLRDLKIPSQANGYLMAEWHFYAAGPSKTNERKLWTTGTPEERRLITNKIAIAAAWQKERNIPTWVGAWMPGNYNDGNDYSVAEQAAFASFMVKSLTDAGIPFAVNADSHFYDREKGSWIPEMRPVFEAVFGTGSPDRSAGAAPGTWYFDAVRHVRESSLMENTPCFCAPILGTMVLCSLKESVEWALRS